VCSQPTDGTVVNHGGFAADRSHTGLWLSFQVRSAICRQQGPFDTSIGIGDDARNYKHRDFMILKAGGAELPTARVVSKGIRLIALIFAALSVTFPALAGQSADAHVHTDRARQLNSQIDRLIAVIKDEYAAEAPHGRQLQFVDVPKYGTIAIASFVIEGFGDGNNVHQFLAVFGPPDDLGPKFSLPYYALSALKEVGDGCAVDVRSGRVSGIRGDGSLTLTLPTFTVSTTGSCEGRTSLSYVLRSGGARLGQLNLR